MNYWIMKSEPDVFSIFDLKNRKNQTEPWNGVRNYQARNFMKEMKIHDQAFFYHSSCDVPGIAGLVEISKEAYPDHTSWDKKSTYHDPRSSSEKPLWFMVDVTFKKEFKPILSLEELRKFKELSDLMILRKGNRLSITPISEKEFQFIKKVAQP